MEVFVGFLLADWVLADLAWVDWVDSDVAVAAAVLYLFAPAGLDEVVIVFVVPVLAVPVFVPCLSDVFSYLLSPNFSK